VIDRKSILFQTLYDKGSDFFVILDYQQAHR